MGLLLAANSKNASLPKQVPVTAVSGPSWLNQRHLDLAGTQLARMGGSAAARDTARQEPNLGTDLSAREEPFYLTGADLYRLNCQSCHSPSGGGAPPEINSLLPPVQATSRRLTLERAAQRGMPIAPAMAASMARDAEQAIRDRLQHGGKNMPSFAQLRPEEVNALFGYLRHLAQVPSARPDDLVVYEPAAHVGEEVVKGTCHTCHDATGNNGRCMMGMGMRGGVPSLASLPDRVDVDAMINQVQDGSQMCTMCRHPRMPELPFFTDNEIAAAYLYLQAYPPRE